MTNKKIPEIETQSTQYQQMIPGILDLSEESFPGITGLVGWIKVRDDSQGCLSSTRLAKKGRQFKYMIDLPASDKTSMTAAYMHEISHVALGAYLFATTGKMPVNTNNIAYAYIDTLGIGIEDLNFIIKELVNTQCFMDNDMTFYGDAIACAVQYVTEYDMGLLPDMDKKTLETAQMVKTAIEKGYREHVTPEIIGKMERKMKDTIGVMIGNLFIDYQHKMLTPFLYDMSIFKKRWY